MFCYQCEETVNQTGCTKVGVCGKTDIVSDQQDELIYLLKRIAKDGKGTDAENKFIMDSLFATITNANFDSDFFTNMIATGKTFIDITDKEITDNAGVLKEENKDLRSLKELITYGLKGLSAYLYHASALGYTDPEIFIFIRTALASLLDNRSADELTALALKCGEVGVATMALLDKANTEKYGNPEPTEVNLGVGDNPAILISGHDLKDLEELLEQTKDTGIDVYTHCEMLPANSYPQFKKYNNLNGNYGGAWWNQRNDFESFNGPILMTTNCLVPPKDTYKERLYTTGVVGFENIKHISDRKTGGTKDFSKIITQAKTCSPPEQIETGTLMGGFAHTAVLSLADKVIDAVKAGKIKRFVVMAGCDGRQNDRTYYTEFAEALPKDTVILTAGCAKYRYNKLDLGAIDGIPRVLDAGQCNDSYSLVVIAQKLAEAFELDDINDLPISYNISWYEQKAVLVLLALLHLGVKKIHLGPKLPAFVSPGVLKVLVDNFEVAGIGEVKDDIDLLVP